MIEASHPAKVEVDRPTAEKPIVDVLLREKRVQPADRLQLRDGSTLVRHGQACTFDCGPQQCGGSVRWLPIMVPGPPLVEAVDPGGGSSCGVASDTAASGHRCTGKTRWTTRSPWTQTV